MNLRKWTPVLGLVLGLSPAASLASPAFIKVRTQVFQEYPFVDVDGVRKMRREPATRLSAGSEVIYEVGYSNTGPRPQRVVITNPLPADLLYLSYAARVHDADLEVSTDGGRRFGTPEAMGVTRPESITHVRWRLRQPVQPGEAGQVSLRARLR